MAGTAWQLAGLDIAWRLGNPSALAVGQLSANVLQIDEVVQQAFSVTAMADFLHARGIHGVAIDGPTIITNVSGMRDCERAIASTYGGRGVACYPANLALWADCQSLQLSRLLQLQGFAHGIAQSDRCLKRPWQIECYPHAALLELFQLPYRLAYKKGSVAERIRGQQRLAEWLLGLSRQRDCGQVIPIYTPAICQQTLDLQVIGSLRGLALKANEDCLDALVCVIIAAYHQRQQSQVFGDSDHGFIVVPKPRTQHRTGVE